MLEDQPSKTAYRVALRRAQHQVWDEPRIFDDPVALKIIGRNAAEEIQTGGAGSRAGSFLRAFIVARSRFAEEHLARAVGRGVEQYVVLGAGLDTFAYRNPFHQVRVFEVDFPATQAWKRRLLRAGSIVVPESLTFAPVDFEKDTLAHGLAAAGFNENAPAFFSWLGVTPYLAEETVFATLRWIASICAGNSVAFDYAVPRSSLSFLNRIVFDALSRRVAAAGEPFVSFFDPKQLAQKLSQIGYAHVEDLSSTDINARYFTARSDGLRVRGGLGHLLCARR